MKLHGKEIEAGDDNMKALELLKLARIDTPIEWKELDEAIAELEGLNSCDGCKWDYKIENIDSQTGYRCDDISPDACYICSRNMNDRYEPKDK